MSDYDLPELPSDEELGITDEDREQLEEGRPHERPELSKEEMIALLGETFSPKKRVDAPEKKKPTAASSRRVQGPRNGWKGPVTLAFLIGVSVVASSRTGLPRPVPVSASDTLFSSSRAMSMLIEIARAPHPPGSPEHARVRNYLLGRLSSLGLEPDVQTAVSMVRVPGGARAATVRNVFARLPGTASTGTVLVTAHYDTRELTPGAADDGSGVVAILEALRALRAAGPLRNDIVVLFTDAEELTMLGARAFVEEHPWMRDVSLVLSFEMRGGGGPSIMFETNDRNGWVVRALRDFDPHPFANSLMYEAYARMPNDTDFSVFKEAGTQGLNFAGIDRAWVYHGPSDTPENLSEATLQHHGLHALAALKHFGRADLSDVDAPDVVYFTVPFLGLVVYRGFWVYVITAGLLALMVLTTLAARRRGARMGGIVAGLGFAVVAAAGSFGVAVALLRSAARFHLEAGALEGSLYYSEGWYVLALACAVLAIVTVLHGAARRWLSSVEITLGSLFVPLILAVWLTFVAPHGAMDLQWPLAAALLSCLLAALLGSRAGATVGWVAALLLTVPVLVLMVPLVELLWIGFSIRAAGVLAVLMATTVYLCLPAVDALRHPNAWWASLVGLGAGAAAMGLGVLAARPNAERPLPSTLVYAYEHGTGNALWATTSTSPAALAWAAARAGSPLSDTGDLSAFGYPPGDVSVTEAPVVSAPTPEVQVVSDTIVGASRRVALEVRSRIGAEMLRFQLDPGGGTRLLAVDGTSIEDPADLRWLEYWGTPDGAIAIDLDMPADAPIGLHVVEHLLRPETLLGAGTFRRPADLAPNVRGMSDRAVFGFSVAAFADPRHAFMPTSSPGPPSGEPLTSAPESPDSAGSRPDTARPPSDTVRADQPRI